MRESLKVVLESHGYKADMVESAEDGLEAIGSNSYFMVITDARLEGMSGYEFLQESHERWPDIPVLMITAYATPKLAVEAIQSGAVDYLLSNPFKSTEIAMNAVDRAQTYTWGQTARRLQEIYQSVLSKTLVECK